MAADSRYLSIPHAARILGVSRNTVYKRIAAKLLKAETIAGRLVVLASSLPPAPHPRET